MFHYNTLVVASTRVDASTSLFEGSVVPGILTAKALQDVLFAGWRNGDADCCDEIISPYGRMPRPTRKPRNRSRHNDANLFQCNFRSKHELIARRKHCSKLDPIPAVIPSQLLQARNQSGSGDAGLEAPDEQSIEHLRSGLQQTNFKLQRDADRLQHEIQWIHGHFPVLKLANVKCSRNLRQQLFRNAVQHVSTNFMLRKTLMFWYQKLLDARRKERLQLSASRQLVAMFEKVSFDRVVGKFSSWRNWVLECQIEEKMAASITLQRFARLLQSRREERESAEQQEALMKALGELIRNAKIIQRAYRRHRRAVQQCQYEVAARKIQHIETRRVAYNGYIEQQKAARLLQGKFRAYIQQRNRKRAIAIAELFDRSCDKSAQRIQNTWRGYLSWRYYELPVDIVQSLVDHVEYLGAVHLIQGHLRGFQCRYRNRKKNDSAVRIQNFWRAGKHRMILRNERQIIRLHRDLAASRLQRTYRRSREERKIRSVLHQSTRPLYLRACEFGNSFRDHFRVSVAKSACVVIQTTWRRYVAYKQEKCSRLAAASTIQRFLKRRGILSMWRNAVFNAHCRDEAARNIQRWIRKLCHRLESVRIQPVAYALEQVSAVSKIQRWYRYCHSDSWGILLARLLATELPRCIEAVNQIKRCWNGYCARKEECSQRANTIASLIKQQQRAEVEHRAAHFIQRMFKRMIDRRDGKVLLHRYKILFRREIKRKQQRVIVHKYLEEKSQQRKKKQETKTASLAIRRASIATSNEPSQALGLDSYSTELSAFTLDETPNETTDSGWADTQSPQIDSPVQYWSEEYQRAYLYDPVTGISTWL
ncbi:hypothetical protein L914_19803 [Phytophthora nicotianae]|uniref:Uncharacterized protein n=1 Tax=Phytophthora nicotianae TaxID=4792 RepID=W2M963_PHYNI|nr:hypothetical protein L914_19803 [Phytophthora nicotianae]